MATGVVYSQGLNRTPDVTQTFRPIAEITDPGSVETLIDAYLLTDDPAEVEMIEIIDVTNNGFGTDDIMVVYPSLNVYSLENSPGSEIEEIMRGWSFSDQRRDNLNRPADTFYPAYADTLESWQLDEPQIVLVQNSLIADLLESLNRNYLADPISIRFERDDEGFTFQMWGYEENAFQFTPRPPATPDSIAVHDLMYVLYSDSTIVADTTYYDLIFVNRTIEDIIYMPGKEGQFQPFNTASLPGNRPSSFKGNNNQAIRND